MQIDTSNGSKHWIYFGSWGLNENLYNFPQLPLFLKRFSQFKIKIIKDNTMKITKERVEQILPQNIKVTTLLSETDKNVLAMLMHSFLVSKEAQDSGFLVISSNKLRSLLEMNRDVMMNSLRILEEFELYTRIKGKPRRQGEISKATEYHFNWNNIFNRPLMKKTCEELFLKQLKSLETSTGTPITITNTITNTTAISTSIEIASSTTNTTTTSITTSNSESEHKSEDSDSKSIDEDIAKLPF